MKRITDAVSKMLEWTVGTLFLILAATAFAQVFFRYGLRSSLVWAHELDILLMIWAVWLGAAVGLYRKGHLRITLLNDRFSVKVRTILLVLIDIATVLFLILLGIKGIEVVQSHEGTTLVSMAIPRGLMFAAAPVGAVFMAFLFIPALIDDVKGLFLLQRERRRN
jgi:TRAP-type C4-dicarboxylate transport system permease small subunit